MFDCSKCPDKERCLRNADSLEDEDRAKRFCKVASNWGGS